MASNHLPFGNYSFQDCVRSQPQHPPLVRLVGSDPTTSPLSGVCSTNWAIDANNNEKEQTGEGGGSRTPACGFGDRRATVTLHRHNLAI